VPPPLPLPPPLLRQPTRCRQLRPVQVLVLAVFVVDHQIPPAAAATDGSFD
jgi:hypothetical protein